MKKVLITGANGFIGTALVKELSSNGYKLIAIVKNEEENVDSIKDISGVDIHYCDLSHIEQLPNIVIDRDIDTCIHLAWIGSFGESRADYSLQLENVKYSMNLINALSKMKIKRFVAAGTLAERDVINYHPTDGATPNAVSMYGIAKVTAHYMTKTECTKRDIEHIWCYLSNTYGVGNTTNNFINMASNKMLNKERPSFTLGLQTYDFVYITDTVRAIMFAAEKGKKNTAYYLGSTKERKLSEYILAIRDAIDPSIEVFLGEIPFNGNSLPESEYDTSKLVIDTGYEPKVSFEQGIKKTIAWLKKMKE